MENNNNNSPAFLLDKDEIILIKSENNTNIGNEKLFNELKKEHIDDGGKMPNEYALTELIKIAIINRDYKIYYGGGYEHRTENRIKLFDVVAYFNLTSDVFFMVCTNNTEGDSCVLHSCNSDCKILTLIA